MMMDHAVGRYGVGVCRCIEKGVVVKEGFERKKKPVYMFKRR